MASTGTRLRRCCAVACLVVGWTAVVTATPAKKNWEPFQPVHRPVVPHVKQARWGAQPIDAFIAAQHEARGLTPRPEASREVLLRRVTVDLIGLNPTPAEQEAFLRDTSADAYGKVVDRLLEDPRHGERWGRHWMDVWRYSDWAGWSGGGQIRDSKPHIWRWRDWIVESLNADKGYDRMVLEMLAADELVPGDVRAARATGFLVRNYKMLSREQWLEDTVKHTAQAFLGVTVGCAKCHDHRVDPITQDEYYRLRSVFEPHWVRTDRVPGELDTGRDGLVRAFDTDTNPATYFFVRGDERRPDTNRVMRPGVPAALAGFDSGVTEPGGALRVTPVNLTWEVAHPDRRGFVQQDLLAAAGREEAGAEAALVAATGRLAASVLTNAHGNLLPASNEVVQAQARLETARASLQATRAVLQVETLEKEGRGNSEEWKEAARGALAAQRRQGLAEARHQWLTATIGEQALERQAAASARGPNVSTNPAANLVPDQVKAAAKTAKDWEAARARTAGAALALTNATQELAAPLHTGFKARPTEDYPATSTGRRLAFARWVAHPENPLTARVAMNHVWLRHFGVGLVPTLADFGANGRPPSHPELLDWLASEFVRQKWSLKAMHRMMVTSQAYRMASTPDATSARIDPDNVSLWRMNPRRLEAEAVRDNLLQVSGTLDPAMGGPDIDHTLGLTSRRRSLYLRIAAEKEVEFLKIFDGPAVTECYLRRPTVMPQQALALGNSELSLTGARALARALEPIRDIRQFVAEAFRRVLARRPTAAEVRECRAFLEGQAGPAALGQDSHLQPRERLMLVLLNHSDFVTIR